MKMRHLVVATATALISLGAIAGGQQHSESAERAAPQAADETSMIREALAALRGRGHAATPQGLREFQQAQGIEPSGELDEQTLAALGVDVSASSGASSESAAQPGETTKN